MIKLSVIIPFLNEEKTITKSLDKVIKQADNILLEILLINDGSTDNSSNVVREYIQGHDKIKNVEFVYMENDRNYGKGYSCKKGIKEATGDFLIIQDADLEYYPDDYKKLLKKIKEGKLDFVYGSRVRGFFINKNNYSTITFLLGGLFVSFFTSILSFKLVTDEPTCYKLFDKKLKQFLLLPDENGFEWEPAITILLLRKGFKYGEVPIKYSGRKPEEGKKIKIKDGIKAIITLLKRRFKKI